MQEPAERQVTWADYMRVLYRGRWIILISFLAVVISTAYFTFTAEPVYEAAAKLMIEEEGGMGENLFEFSSFMKKETMMNNQVEILKSRTLAEKVVEELQDSDHADELRILGNVPEGGNGRGNPIGALKDWVFGLFSSKGEDGADEQGPSFDDFVQNLRGSIAITPIRDTDMIDIKFQAKSPFEAAFVTNAIATVYKRENQSQSQAEVREVKQFLEDQLDLLEDQLTKSEEALKAYKEQEKVAALDEETQELVKKAAEFESMLKEAETSLAENQERLKFINTQLDKSKQNFDVEAISATPYLEEIKRQLAEKEADLASLMAGLVEVGALEERGNQAKIQMQEKQIEALKEKFREEVAKLAATEVVDPVGISETLFARKIEIETELQSLKPRVEALEGIVARYTDELESLPEKSLQLARLTRTAQVDEKLYIMLQEKYQESRITEVGQLGIVRIVDPAVSPQYPVKPKKKLNLILGILVGLGLGVGITFVREYMDNSVRTIEDVQGQGYSLMGTIPVIRPEMGDGRASHVALSDKDHEVRIIESRLVTHLRPKSPISESYRTLRTNIHFAKTESPVRAVLVTSAGPKEGKSTTVANLAITMAQMGTKTLLVDADLRRPVLHKLFGVDRSVGLSNLLVGKAKLADVAQRTPVENLNIIPCGTLPPNPSELLGSEQMRKCIEEFKKEYEMVVLDTPPVIAVTDAPVLAPFVDGVLLVVNSGLTRREALARAGDLLDHVKASVLGVLLNNIHVTSMYGSYYYYYYYHYYYGRDDEKKRKKSRRRRKKRRLGYGV